MSLCSCAGPPRPPVMAWGCRPGALPSEGQFSWGPADKGRTHGPLGIKAALFAGRPRECSRIMGMLRGRRTLLDGQHQEWVGDVGTVVHPTE